jgi:hypothetical protein
VGDEEPGLGAGDVFLPILGHSTAASKPCEGSFDDPFAARQWFAFEPREGAGDNFVLWVSGDSVRTAHPDESLELRKKLASETAIADAAERARDQAESDRDRWRGMAEKLADKPRRGWCWR